MITISRAKITLSFCGEIWDLRKGGDRLLHFKLQNYTVSFGSEKIVLLRKEYLLLRCLFQHEGLTLTRTQLLDAVWTDEYPSDRTVDDHIYRLRKKLAAWQEDLQIETVKGTGYRLTLQKAPASPFTQDTEFQQLTESLISKYHLYGHGDAIFTLISQTNLSFPVDEELENMLLFIRGDAKALLRNTKVPFSSKALILLHMYLLFTDDEKEALVYLERALKQHVFSPYAETEARVLAPIFFSLMSWNLEQADFYIQEAEKDITTIDHGFYPFFQLNKLLLAVFLGDQEKIGLLRSEMETFFETRPYLRELAVFQTIKGLHASMLSSSQDAFYYLEEGMRMMKQSKFRSHQFLLLKVCFVFFKRRTPSPEMKLFVEDHWNSLLPEVHRKELVQEIKNMLDHHLL